MTTARALGLLTGGAFIAGIAILSLAIFVPSLQPYAPLPLIIVSGIWAALSLRVLLAGARRAHKLVVLIALVLVAILSLFTRGFGFPAFLLAYFGAFLFLGIVLVLAAMRLFRKKPGLRALVVPLTMMTAGVCGVLLSAWSSKPLPPLPERAMSTSDELKYIHDTDQSDRATMYIVLNPGRDRTRLERVKALYRAGQITQPIDRFNAAMIYQHASCADDFQVAYELASEAVGPGVPIQFPPLAHLAYDRWQMSLGKQQTYGTQLFPVPIKRPCPAGSAALRRDADPGAVKRE